LSKAAYHHQDNDVNYGDDFRNKVALIAGGTGALGREISLAFLGVGAHVATTYRREEEFAELLAAAKRAGAGVPRGILLDATNSPAAVSAVERLVAEHGRLDILVNAIGGYAGGKNVWEEEPATYQRMMALNLESGFVLARATLPIMIRQNRGWIVTMASRAGYGRSAGAALYSASKAGALAFFDSLAEEVKPYAIYVNSVVPSIFDTPANRRAMPSADPSRWPKPAEIAKVILFLCSEQAGVIHGAAIPVYGRT
jgi:NAD(P)-dependent dehydrogenase (short-subunit alcohol dehydrogenase family)